MVGCGRLRRCLIVNCNRSRAVRGSGGCVVGCCRLWSAAALSYCKFQEISLRHRVWWLRGRLLSAVVGCGAVLL